MSKTATTHVNNLKLLRGYVYLYLYNDDGTRTALKPASPAAEFSYEQEIERVEYTSQEEGSAEILDETVIETVRNAKLKLNNLDDVFFRLYLAADATKISQSGSVTNEISPYVSDGCTIFLGGAQHEGSGVYSVTSVSVSSYEGANAIARVNEVDYAVGDVYKPAVANSHWYMCTVAGESAAAPPAFTTNGTTYADGTATFVDMGLIVYTVDDDYELDDDDGMIHVVIGGAISDAISRVPAIKADQPFRLETDYTKSAKTFQQLATGALPTRDVEFFFVEQNAKGDNGRWHAHKARLSPDGGLPLKSGGDYGAMDFALKFIKTSGKPTLTRNGTPVTT